jgi:WD40 repeat protein
VQYDVYIAYHPSDKRLARALKRAFERFAQPWNRIRALHVWGTAFATPLFEKNPLFGNLLPERARQGRADEALADAGRFVLLASPEAAKSERVTAALGRWLEGHPIEDLILVLTEGEIAWDPAVGDFDWARTPSLPQGLKGKFKARPLIVDLRWARAERKLLPGYTRFRDALLDLVARLHGRSPDAIEADDLRRQRRERLLGAGLLAVLVVGSAFALYWAMVASGERSAALARLAKAEADLDRERQARADAERRARAAGARGLSPLPVGARDGAPSDPRQKSTAGRLASEAEVLLQQGGDHVPTGVLLAVEAMSRYPSAKADGVLRQGLHALLPPVTTLDQEGPVHRAAFSPDGTHVVAAGGDETARVFEVSSGRAIAAIEHDAAVKAVAFSPDGLLVASADADGGVHVSDPKTGQSNATIEEDDPVVAVAFSPDGHFLATAGSDARIYALEGVREVRRFSQADAPVGVAFSLDGTTLMTASGNEAVTWDLQSGAETLRMRHDAAVAALAPSADGRYLATGVGDGTVRIWDRGSGQELKRIAHEGPVTAVSYSLDGRYLATASGQGARLLDGEALRDMGRVVESDPVEGVMLSLDGKLLVTAAGNRAHLFRTTAGVTLIQAMHDDLVQGVALSPDGALLATASWDKSARIWDTETGRERQRLDHLSLVEALALSRDGKLLATASGQRAMVWDAASGTEQRTLQHEDTVKALAFGSDPLSPDGAYLATGSEDGSAAVWALADGQSVVRVRHEDGVLAVTLSADGRLLVTGGQDGSARLWDIQGGKEVGRVELGGAVQGVALSPDGQSLATASHDKTVRVWQVAGGKQLFEMAHDDSVRAVAFSSDGRMLASAGFDKTVRLWDAANGVALGRAQHDAPVLALAFSADDRYLASASGNAAAVSLWRPEDLVALGCGHVSRNLSADEWDEHLGDEPYRKTCQDLPGGP